MMLPSRAAARTIPTGLGAVSWNCYLFPFTPDCASQWGQVGVDIATIPTEAEQQAAVKADIERAAGAGTPNYNPDLAAEQYAQYLKDTAAYAAAHPEDYANYKAQQTPTCSFWLGTGTLGQTVCPNPGPYLLGTAAALVGLLVWMRR